jgi:hypothetical protein
MSDQRPMLMTDRLRYSPIVERPPLRLPDGARMVVWVIVAIEEWDPTQPMPRTVLTPPAGGSPMPDVPNWAWHEYGNRVGFWRFIDIFDEFDIPAAICINGTVLSAYPQIARHRPRVHFAPKTVIRRIAVQPADTPAAARLIPRARMRCSRLGYARPSC